MYRIADVLDGPSNSNHLDKPRFYSELVHQDRNKKPKKSLDQRKPQITSQKP